MYYLHKHSEYSRQCSMAHVWRFESDLFTEQERWRCRWIAEAERSFPRMPLIGRAACRVCPFRCLSGRFEIVPMDEVLGKRHLLLLLVDRILPSGIGRERMLVPRVVLFNPSNERRILPRLIIRNAASLPHSLLAHRFLFAVPQRSRVFVEFFEEFSVLHLAHLTCRACPDTRFS